MEATLENHLIQPLYSTCVTGQLADWLSCLNLGELVKNVFLFKTRCFVWKLVIGSNYLRAVNRCPGFLYIFSCMQIKGKNMFLIPPTFCKSPNCGATNLAVGAALSLLIIKINGEQSMAKAAA